MWVDYRGPLSTVYNDGEISAYGWIIEVHSVQPSSTTSYLFHLKLDSSFDIFHFIYHFLIMCEERREFPCFVQSWSEHSWYLLDDGITSQKGIVSFSCEEETEC